MPSWSKYLVPDSIRRFQEELRCSAPLTRVSEFHNDTKITEVIQSKRSDLMKHLMEQVSTYDAWNISKLISEVDSGIEQVSKQYIQQNQSHKMKSEALLENIVDFLWNDFYTSLKSQLSSDPYMNLGNLQELVRVERVEATNFFLLSTGKLGNGDPNCCGVHQTILNAKLDELENEIVRKQKQFLEGPATEERRAFEEMKKRISKTWKEMKNALDDGNFNFENDPGKGINKALLLHEFEDIRDFICEQDRFSKREYCEVHCLVAEVMIKSAEILIRAEETRLHSEDAFELVETFGLIATEIFLQYRNTQMENVASSSSKTKENVFMLKINGEFATVEDHCNALMNKMKRKWTTQKMKKAIKCEIKIKTEPKVKSEPLECSDIDSENNFEVKPKIEKSSDYSDIDSEEEFDANEDPETSDSDEKPQLNSLIFRLTYDHVSMGTISEGKFIVLENNDGELTTPIIVGINRNGEVVHGKQAIKECTPLSRWWITDFLGQGNSHGCQKSMTFKTGRNKWVCKKISVEFLLGYLLRWMKTEAESKLKRSFHKTIITFPVWFCSTERIQVRDAALIAGFSEVSLVNEEASAAYYLISARFSTMSGSDERSNFLVLSENYGVLTAILYSYWDGKSLKKAFVCNQEFAKTNVKSRRQWCENKEVEIIEKSCSALLKKLDWHPSETKTAFFLTSLKSGSILEREWLQAVKNVVTEAVQFVGVNSTCEVVMHGASMLSHEDNGIVMANSMAHNCFRNFKGSREHEIVIPKTEFRSQILMNNKIRQYVVELKELKVEANFYQKSVFGDGLVHVGSFKLDPYASSSIHQVYLVFHVHSDGIIELLEVKRGRIKKCGGAKKRAANGKDDDVEIVTNFTWKTPALTGGQKKDWENFSSSLITKKKVQQSKIAKNGHPKTTNLQNGKPKNNSHDNPPRYFRYK